MDLVKFKEDVIEKTIIFNELDENQFGEFVNAFNEMTDADKEFYLNDIIDNEPENNLLEGNYEKLFSEQNVIEILHNIL